MKKLNKEEYLCRLTYSAVKIDQRASLLKLAIEATYVHVHVSHEPYVPIENDYKFYKSFIFRHCKKSYKDHTLNGLDGLILLPYTCTCQ